MVFLTSDTHWGHTNILKYTQRPFKDVHHMDEMLIANWNDTVSDNDDIYHLGDFFFYKDVGSCVKVLERLNGRKHWILGNHDYIYHKNAQIFSQYFQWVREYYELKYNHRKYILCHYPLLTWNKAHRGNYHCHGHTHGNVDHLNQGTTRLDVGIDGPLGKLTYSPISIVQIEEYMNDMKYQPVDHHGRNMEDM